MWVLVCLLAIVTADDLAPTERAGPSSELLIVADDDLDGSAELPACALCSVGCTNLCCYVHRATEITGPAKLRTGFVLRYGPRGPPEGSRCTVSRFGPTVAGSASSCGETGG